MCRHAWMGTSKFYVSLIGTSTPPTGCLFSCILLHIYWIIWVFRNFFCWVYKIMQKNPKSPKITMHVLQALNAWISVSVSWALRQYERETNTILFNMHTFYTWKTYTTKRGNKVSLTRNVVVEIRITSSPLLTCWSCLNAWLRGGWYQIITLDTFLGRNSSVFCLLWFRCDLDAAM